MQYNTLLQESLLSPDLKIATLTETGKKKKKKKRQRDRIQTKESPDPQFGTKSPCSGVAILYPFITAKQNWFLRKNELCLKSWQSYLAQWKTNIKVV